METDTIYNMDCLEGMKLIPDGSIDAIICDLPYGTTANKWDSIIPLDLLWEQYRRVLKPNGAIVLFCSQPFTSALIASNFEDYSYNWIWDKGNGANPLLATKMPIKNYEEISVFYVQYSPNDWRREYFRKLSEFIGKTKKAIIDECGQALDHCFRFDSHQFSIPTEDSYNLLIQKYGIDKMQGFLPFAKIAVKRYERIYNPQGLVYNPKKNRRGGMGSNFDTTVKNEYVAEYENYPTSILYYDKDPDSFHPTQKPVDLLRYLIRTYSNEGDTILDNCMGSGTTAVACIKEKRHYIGFELNKDYWNKACRRIDAEKRQLSLF